MSKIIIESKGNPEFLSDLKTGDKVREKDWKTVYTVTAKRGKKVTLTPDEVESKNGITQGDLDILNANKRSVFYDNKEGLYIIEGLEMGDIENIDEDRWITMHGAHFLVSDKGKLRDKEMDKKINGTVIDKAKKTVKKVVNKVRKTINAK